MALSLLTMAGKAKTTIKSLRNPAFYSPPILCKRDDCVSEGNNNLLRFRPQHYSTLRLNQELLMRPDSYSEHGKQMWCFRLKIGFRLCNYKKKHFQSASVLNITLCWLRTLNKCQYWSKCRQIHLHCKIVRSKSKNTCLQCNSMEHRKSCLFEKQCKTVSSGSEGDTSNSQVFATTFLG